MIGKILSWNGANGTLLNMDEGDTIYPFAVGETSGPLSIGDVVKFDAELTSNAPLGNTPRAINVQKQ
jgi:hypothetical protein